MDQVLSTVTAFQPLRKCIDPAIYYPGEEFVDWRAREVFQDPGRLMSAIDGDMDRSDR